MLSTRQAILQVFVDIGENEHYEKVLFYERNQDDMVHLELDQQVYLKYHYVHSLYEIGRYQRVLKNIDDLIEIVFLNNKNIDGRAAFEPLLFVKAKSLYRMMKYDNSACILEQLIGINPFESKYAEYLKTVHLDHLNFKSASTKIGAVILIFVSSIGCGSFWLLKDSLNSIPHISMFLIFLAPSLIALMLLGTNFFFNRYKSSSKVKDVVKQKRIKFFNNTI